MTYDEASHPFRPPAEGEWVVIPRNVVARRPSGERVELPRWIARTILECVPTSVAVGHSAFRVDASEENFTLLFPEDASSDRYDALRFILNRDFDVLYGERNQVDRLILAAYGEPTGDRTVSVCNARFRVQCPLQWNELRATADASVRFCDACRQPVHFCENDEEARIRAAAGQCVAIDERAPAEERTYVTMGLIIPDRRDDGSIVPPRRRRRRRD